MKQIPIVERLEAFERASPDFIGVPDGGCHTVYHRNPDGPEAAAIIRDLVTALGACVAVAERPLKNAMNLNGKSPYDLAMAALSRAQVQP